MQARIRCKTEQTRVSGEFVCAHFSLSAKNTDFFKVGIPFPMAAIIPAYIYLWLMYGIA